jgi:HD-GYP domain-containing protein (c-di-GMP phosphodiesterase class II)
MSLSHVSDSVRVALGSDADCRALLEKLSQTALPTRMCETVDELIAFQPAAVVLDQRLLNEMPLADLRLALPHVAFIARSETSREVEFPLSGDVDTQLRLIKTACEMFATRSRAKEQGAMAAAAEADLTRLTEVGVALSAERDLDKLLERVLEAAQDTACCDAASIYLLDDKQEPAELVFKLTRNDSMELPFAESRFPVSKSSISGFVALTGESIHCEDVYLMGPEQPFRFNKDFDKRIGYRTRSLYCVPMIDYQGKVVGVLQVINRKQQRSDIINADNAETLVIDFNAQVKESVSALASLSAVAIQTRMLIDSINNLFENFVNASVAAIEQRDPTTSGHSFRVADLSVALARALPQANRSDLIRFDPTDARLRELRYASLLHDFGKVGVREHVLMKAKKLYDWEFSELRYRLALAEQTMRADSAEAILRLYERGKADSATVADIKARHAQDRERLQQFMATVIRSNEPSLLPDECKENLGALSSFECADADGTITPLLNDNYLEALSMAKGSLTLAERKEIESHVVHTANFLRMIPWTDELAGIPDIAGRHHEKLDGTGYPDGLVASDIPLQSRIMTICDIYDALTATDRPYKKAAPDEIAFRILREEAHKGMLDRDIVELFIGVDTPAYIRGREYPRIETGCETGHSHSVCDPDTHVH